MPTVLKRRTLFIAFIVGVLLIHNAAVVAANPFGVAQLYTELLLSSPSPWFPRTGTYLHPFTNAICHLPYVDRTDRAIALPPTFFRWQLEVGQLRRRDAAAVIGEWSTALGCYLSS